MKVLVRAVISGFGFSLGAAIFRKVSDRLGLTDDKNGKNVEVKPDPLTVSDRQPEPS